MPNRTKRYYLQIPAASDTIVSAGSKELPTALGYFRLRTALYTLGQSPSFLTAILFFIISSVRNSVGSPFHEWCDNTATFPQKDIFTKTEMIHLLKELFAPLLEAHSEIQDDFVLKCLVLTQHNSTDSRTGISSYFKLKQQFRKKSCWNEPPPKLFLNMSVPKNQEHSTILREQWYIFLFYKKCGQKIIPGASKVFRVRG